MNATMYTFYRPQGISLREVGAARTLAEAICAAVKALAAEKRAEVKVPEATEWVSIDNHQWQLIIPGHGDDRKVGAISKRITVFWSSALDRKIIKDAFDAEKSAKPAKPVDLPKGEAMVEVADDGSVRRVGEQPPEPNQNPTAHPTAEAISKSAYELTSTMKSHDGMAKATDLATTTALLWILADRVAELEKADSQQ